MNKFLTAATLLAMSASANAADIRGSIKDDPIYTGPVPTSTWTGFYIGIEAGGGAGVFDAARDLEHGVDFFHTDKETGVREDTRLLTDRESSRIDLGMEGIFGGFNAEYKFQAGRAVFGVFGNFDWSGMEGDHSYSREIVIHTGGPSDFQLAHESGRLNIEKEWNADLGVKAGFLATPDTMIYGLVGASWGRFNLKGGSDLSFIDGEVAPFPGSSLNQSETLVGLTLGAGIETRLDDAKRWLLGVEGRYTRYTDLGDSFSKANDIGEDCGVSFSTADRVNGDIDEWTARMTLRYKIN